MWPWCVKMPTNNLLMLLLSLMLMTRNVLLTVWKRLWSWCLVKISRVRFVQLFKLFFRPVWWIFWGWSSGTVLKLKFGQYSDGDVCFFEVDAWPIFWCWILTTLPSGPLCLWQFLDSNSVLLLTVNFVWWFFFLLVLKYFIHFWLYPCHDKKEKTDKKKRKKQWLFVLFVLYPRHNIQQYEVSALFGEAATFPIRDRLNVLFPQKHSPSRSCQAH